MALGVVRFMKKHPNRTVRLSRFGMCVRSAVHQYTSNVHKPLTAVVPSFNTYVKTLTGNDKQDEHDKRNTWQMIGRTRHVGLAALEFQNRL